MLPCDMRQPITVTDGSGDLQLYIAAGILLFTAVQAVAVVVSIYLLGREVKSAAFSVRLSSYQAVVDGFSALESRISRDKESAEIYEEGLKGLGNLDPVGFRQFSEFMATTFNLYDLMYFQYSSGALPGELWSGWCLYMREQLKCPGIAEWWERKRHLYPKPFAEYVDGGTCPSNAELFGKRR